jgi:site-specific DNA recombinase
MTQAREYLRVSFDRSGQERSQDEQHDDNHRAADRNEWTLGNPYRENGSASASRYGTKARDTFALLMADLKRDRFAAQVLILWESSRGSRKVSEWVTLIELCEERGVRIHITSDGKTYDLSDARDRRSLQEDAVDAEYESSKVSKRTKRAAAATAAAGKPSGRVPFGYRRTYHPETRKLVAQEQEPTEAKVIVELFDRLHKGHSLHSIAADFEQRGIRGRPTPAKPATPSRHARPAKPGVVFSAQHLRSLALNPAYSGKRVHDPYRNPGGHTLSERAVLTDATWPALVDRAVFLAVTRRLTAPDRVTTRPGRGVHLLSMIAVCDVCSGPLAARMSKERQREYTCHRKGCVRVGYHGLDDLAEAAMLAYLSRPDNAGRLTADQGGGERLRAAQERVAEIRAELTDLARQVGAGRLSATLAASAEPAILARLRAAERDEEEMSTPDELRGLIGPAAQVARRWKAAPMSAKREVARLLLSPAVLGELRVTRSLTPGHRCPVAERVVWAKG